MTDGHIGEWALRRLRIGELGAAEAAAVDAHAQTCGQCLTRMRALDDEQARFELELPFERFAAGVERAARGVDATKARPRVAWLAPAMGMAAAVLVAVIAQPMIGTGHIRIKGSDGANMVLRIGGTAGGPQRLAAPEVPEALGPGERVRIGYRSGQHHFVAVVSVDQAGQVTPLYPEFGHSLPADEGEATYYLPDSLEFTGKGAEVVVVVLSDQPLEVDTLTSAARKAYDNAHGDLSKLGRLGVPGEQFRQVLLKP